MVDCLPCATSFHQECWVPDESFKCCCGNVSEAVVIESTKERGGQIKDMENVGDLESTGRKRAAKLYPLDRSKPCEWAGLRNAGGGPFPILGCLGNTQVAIHHGPDKSTLANFVGNVHRICATCHNRWHTLNDPMYPTERPAGNLPYTPVSGEVNPHDGVTKFTPEEFAQNGLMWADRKADSKKKKPKKVESNES